MSSRAVEVQHFFDSSTWTLSYVVFDPQSSDAVIIDPVWNYDQAASTLTSESADEIVQFVEKRGLKVGMILETHVHADHISAAHVLSQKLKCPVAIGSAIIDVQKIFKGVFNLASTFPVDGSQFDILLNDRQELTVGALSFEVLVTPGHTPACCSYRFGDSLFTGDALFMPDYGTGRCDFPGASAVQLYDSIQGKIYELPDNTRVFVGHDYRPNGRPLAFESTIGEQKGTNIHISRATSKDEFVKFRNERDRSLPPPKLLFQSIQINVRGGRLPLPEANGVSYLKLPIR